MASDVNPHKVIYPVRPRPAAQAAGPGDPGTTGPVDPGDHGANHPAGRAGEATSGGFDDSTGPPPQAPRAAPDAGAPRRFAPDHDGIREAMRAAVPEIRECYEAWLQTNPDLHGKLVLSYAIAPTDAGEGEVRDLSVSSHDIAHVPFEGCVKNVMAGVQFGLPIDDGTGEPAPMNVKYPLIFALGDGG